mmetsp:Transcript_3877/g.24573  ORF Transcript_3877/g.24573 Transcript_3877/m.24573 type:complete len:228 (+) Transcript_3877:407-1090(+)
MPRTQDEAYHIQKRTPWCMCSMRDWFSWKPSCWKWESGLPTVQQTVVLGACSTYRPCSTFPFEDRNSNRMHRRSSSRSDRRISNQHRGDLSSFLSGRLQKTVALLPRLSRIASSRVPPLFPCSSAPFWLHGPVSGHPLWPAGFSSPPFACAWRRSRGFGWPLACPPSTHCKARSNGVFWTPSTPSWRRQPRLRSSSVSRRQFRHRRSDDVRRNTRRPSVVRTSRLVS